MQQDRALLVAYHGPEPVPFEQRLERWRASIGADADVVKTGVAASIVILNQEPAIDRLEINMLGGTDTVTTDGLAAGAIQLLVDGVPVG